MIIFPAIDIKDTQCVRLIQGDYSKVTIYENDPLKVANKWQSKGSEFLHIVDLDGAAEGERINKDIIGKIIKNSKVPIQIGGGIRTTEAVSELLDLGAKRIIVGTKAIKDFEWLSDLVKIYGDKICVSIDAKNGYIATNGWKEISKIKVVKFVKKLESINVKTIVYTDIEKDGMLNGPNFSMYEELIEKSNIDIIASGGVSSMDDIIKLKQLKLYGAIVGKALYSGEMSLEEAISC
jgi:phosphoribosylformimino-5-aminoimidazole carboxamide ribotide isomerase